MSSTPHKRYKLLQKLPDANVGTVLILAEDGDAYDYAANGGEVCWYRKSYVENNPEWFEPIPKPQPEISRPPLGVMPEWRHKELRLQELQEAIGRYSSSNEFVPVGWVAEAYAIKQWLESREEEIKLSTPKPSYGKCGVCGNELTYIRGRNPGEQRRLVCPCCTTERLEQINEISSKEYGLTCKNND